jgi:hypothetical protein
MARCHTRRRACVLVLINALENVPRESRSVPELCEDQELVLGGRIETKKLGRTERSSMRNQSTGRCRGHRRTRHLIASVYRDSLLQRFSLLPTMQPPSHHANAK